MAKILFTAQPFGFGPVSKMLAIAENLQGIEKIFFGSGVAYDLAKLHPFEEIHCLSHLDRDKILSLLESADLFINVMDFEIIPLATKARCPQFLVDSLLWFWPVLPAGIREVDIYFCQNFFHSVEKRVHKYNLANAQIIGPITNDNFCKQEKKDQIIINFGGLENPFVEIGINSNYPFVMLEVLLPVVQRQCSKILVTGRERVMELCKEHFGENPSLHFAMLDTRKMLEEIYSSQAIFTAPGIQSFYDSANKVPIFCLPPQNNSNLRNLELLVENRAVEHYMKWEEIYDFHLDRNCQGDEFEIEKILKIIQKFEHDFNGHKYLLKKVEHFFEKRNNWESLVEQQMQTLENLGPSGTRVIVEAILQKIKRKASSFPFAQKGV